MRSLLTAAAVAALVVTARTAPAQQPPTRIAYVNTQALFENAPGRAEAEAAYRRETEAFDAELRRRGDELNRLVTEYQRQEATLAAAEKTKRQAVLQAKEDSLRARQQELQQRAAQRQNELMAPIMEAVRKVLEDIRVEDGYAMILSNEQGASPILVADKNLDITERVVARLKTVAATRPAPSAPPAGAPATAPAGVTRPRPPGE